MHYLYLKAQVGQSKGRPTLPAPDRRWWHFLPSLFLTIGLFIMASAVSPIVYYQFFYSPGFSELAKPVAGDYLVATPATNPEVLGEETGVDMYQASNWFPNVPKPTSSPSKITHYSLSIPKLGIKDAVVEVAGNNLKTSLVQYGGTAFPGEVGNAVIFGHSALPQFFSPTNYETIFTTLPSLKKQDKILVNFDGVSYQYLIEEINETQPNDASILEQRYDDRYLTLVTCVPPGTYLRRLAVKARLVTNENFGN